MLKQEIPSLYWKAISGGCNGNPFSLPDVSVPDDEAFHILPHPWPVPPTPASLPELEPVVSN